LDCASCGLPLKSSEVGAIVGYDNLVTCHLRDEKRCLICEERDPDLNLRRLTSKTTDHDPYS